MELPDLVIGDISASPIWLFHKIFDYFRPKKVKSIRYLNEFKGTKRDLCKLPIMNTHEGTEGTEGLAFRHKFDFSSVKISWISRNTLRLWQMMNAMTIPMKMIAWRSSLCLRSWFIISGLILKSNFVHKMWAGLGVSRISSCSQKFYMKWFSEADIYLAHIKLFIFFPHPLVD